VYAIFKRELHYFYNSVTAYVVTTVFLFSAGWFFYTLVGYFDLVSKQAMQNPYLARQLNLTEGVLQPFFGNLAIVLIFVLPLLTMRLLAEERRSGTAELLFTYPVTDWQVIAGKYLATVVVFLAMLALTLLFPLILKRYSTPEVGAVFSGYLGLALMGMAFIAMGLFFSSLSESQVVAGVITFGAALLFLIVGWIGPLSSSPVVAKLSEQLSILRRLDNFSKGLVDTSDLVFYLNFVALFLFLTARVLDSNRWRA